MKRWIVWAVALCALSAGGAWAAPNPNPPPRRPVPAAYCASILVSSQPAGGDGAAVPTFSTKEILDVSFQVRLRDRTGQPGGMPASFVLKVLTPNGHLYQQSEVPIRLKPNLIPGASNVPPAVKAGPLPVSGTSITQSALYGTWRVVAEPVGNIAGCAASFVLEP